MKNKSSLFAAAALLVCGALLAGCASSVNSRIKKNQQLFDSLPPQAQTDIRAGRVGVGYTPDMVLLALGQPDRQYTRTTTAGSYGVWAYTSRAPNIGIGLGIGGGGRGFGMGGIAIVSPGDRMDDRIRVVFENSRVVSIEQNTN